MTNLADTSRAGLAYKIESEWGETPTSGNIKPLRFTSENLKIERQTTVSEEIRPDRQITDLIATNFSANGEINGEFSVDTYNDFMRAALFSSKDAEDFTSSEATAWDLSCLLYTSPSPRDS